MKKKAFLAFDIGASNGRAFAGVMGDDGILRTEEVYRFSNQFLRLKDGFFWDYAHIYRELLEALKECQRQELEIACIGVDTWAQDYGYLDKNGQLLGLPRCYRDKINALHADEIDPLLGDPGIFYERCGQVKNTISTMRRLYYDRRYQPELVEKADCFLFMPYIFVYLLTGQRAYDITLADAGELGDTRNGVLNRDTARLVGAEDLIPPQFSCGTILGYTNAQVKEETGYDRIPVVCTDSHDTASAVLGIGDQEDFLYVSSGTWSMYGATSETMQLNDKTRQARLCNSHMGSGKIALFTGGTGMYVIQQCMDWWQKNGYTITYPQLTEYALTHESDAFFPFDEIDNSAQNMPEQVKKAIACAGFDVPSDPYELYEIYANSLARQTVRELKKIEEALDKRFEKIYLVGGGSKAEAVNQRIALGSGKQLHKGLWEAAVVGNMLAQMVAVGEVSGWKEAHAVSRRTFFE